MFGVMVMVRVNTTQTVTPTLDPNPQNEIVEGHNKPRVCPEKWLKPRAPRRLSASDKFPNSLQSS